MQYLNKADLEVFLQECEDKLLDNDNKKLVNYPNGAVAPWNSEIIKNTNEQLLKSISGSANVYAIFIAEKGNSEYNIVYIGQTNSKGARTRLTNHLIKKHKKTGAKLSKIIDHIQSGGNIKISWISIDPVSLRHYVEEELIDKHKEILTWNKHGKRKA